MARKRNPPAAQNGTRERGGGGADILRFPGGEPLRVAGVDSNSVAANPDDFRGEVFKGPHFRQLNVPSDALQGDSVRVTGIVHLDNVGVVISDREVRVRVDGPSLNEPRIESVGKLSHCQTRSFQVEVPTPNTADEQLALTVKAQSKTPPGGWYTGETGGPFRVNINTQQQQRRASARKFAPFVIGGAGVGGALATLSDESVGTLALAGGAVGAGSKVVLDQTGGVSLPSFPTTDVAVAGGAALAIALLLNTTGASDVLGPAGEIAGSAIDRGRKAVESASGGGGGVAGRLPSG